MRQGQDGRRIAGLHGTAIKQAQPGAFSREGSHQLGTHHGMHGGYIGFRRCAARADRPDGFISHHPAGGAKAIRQAFRHLLGHHFLSPAQQPVILGFAHANHRDQAGGQGGLGLGADAVARFPIRHAAFRMAQNNVSGAGILQHGGGNIPGMGTLGGLMAILPAKRHHPGANRR